MIKRKLLYFSHKRTLLADESGCIFIDIDWQTGRQAIRKTDFNNLFKIECIIKSAQVDFLLQCKGVQMLHFEPLHSGLNYVHSNISFIFFVENGEKVHFSIFRFLIFFRIGKTVIPFSPKYPMI